MILPFGEDALLVEAGGPAGIASARWAQGLAAGVRALQDGPAAIGAAIGAPIPGATSVLVPFDPERADRATVTAALERLVAGLPEEARTGGGREHVIPVTYDGPDLASVAAETGPHPADVVDLHAATVYEVLFLG
ncbi:MAG: carboxyltransferase domain-containing protein, partial [Chloroflexota bacterium]